MCVCILVGRCDTGRTPPPHTHIPLFFFSLKVPDDDDVDSDGDVSVVRGTAWESTLCYGDCSPLSSDSC